MCNLKENQVEVNSYNWNEVHAFNIDLPTFCHRPESFDTKLVWSVDLLQGSAETMVV